MQKRIIIPFRFLISACLFSVTSLAGGRFTRTVRLNTGALPAATYLMVFGTGKKTITGKIAVQ